MGFIQLGEISRSLLYPFGMCITCIINIITQSLLSSLKFEDLEGETITFSKHPFFLVWLMFLGESSNIIIYIVQRLRTPNKDTQHYHKKLKVNRTGILPRKDKCTVVLIIIILFILDTSTSLTLFVTRQTSYLSIGELLLKLLSTFFTAILTIVVLKYKYYKHHILGFIIVSVALISMTIMEVVIYKLKGNDKSFSSVFIVILFLTYLFSSVQEVYEKYLIDIKFVNPFALIAFEGFGGLFTTSCLLVVFYNVKCVSGVICEEKAPKTEDFIKTWQIISKNPILIILVSILYISITFFNSFRILTNQHYTPTHRSLSDSIASFIAWILKLTIPFLNQTTTKDDVFYIQNIIMGVLYIIMIIGVLIFLEIIILTFCDLDRNTKEKINARQEFFGINNTILPVTDNEESEEEKSQDNSTLY